MTVPDRALPLVGEVRKMDGGVTSWIREAVNMGIQLNGSVMVTCPSLQSASPLHPSNFEAPSGVAVKVTDVPDAKLATHEGAQVIPTGLLVTVPPPVPVLVTAH